MFALYTMPKLLFGTRLSPTSPSNGAIVVSLSTVEELRSELERTLQVRHASVDTLRERLTTA